MNDLTQLGALVATHKWIPAAALIIGLVIRLLKSDTKIPIDIPPRVRVFAPYVLGMVSAVLEHVMAGATWEAAIIHGVLTGALATVGHTFAIDGLRGGKEISIPGLMIPGAAPSPGAPVTVPPPPPPAA